MKYIIIGTKKNIYKIQFSKYQQNPLRNSNLGWRDHKPDILNTRLWGKLHIPVPVDKIDSIKLNVVFNRGQPFSNDVLFHFELAKHLFKNLYVDKNSLYYMYRQSSAIYIWSSIPYSISYSFKKQSLHLNVLYTLNMENL